LFRADYVFATASTGSVEFVKSLGADRVIDYKKERFEDVANDVDVVFDTLDGEAQERSWAVLKPGGSLISTLTEPSKEKTAEHNARTMRCTAASNGGSCARSDQ
jgi:NADPH:quinone reductase-like Zn-dependent oxidoreductase